jgi:outer membrane murein-binding lipoprotein Lpp
MTALHPAVLKLQALDQRAAETLGASHAASNRKTELTNARVRLLRELGELEEYVRGNKGARTEARLDQLKERVAYLDAAIASAGQRYEELNTQALAAKSTAERLREHLVKTIDAGGFEV